MAKRIIHEGKRRFWSGLVDTACGLALGDAHYSWWASVNCRACKCAMADGRWPK